MNESHKYTIYVPAKLSEKTVRTYNILMDIDCNFSRFFQSILNSLIIVAKYINKHKSNFRHYHWYIIIQDKKTGQYFSSCVPDMKSFQSVHASKINELKNKKPKINKGKKCSHK